MTEQTYYKAGKIRKTINDIEALERDLMKNHTCEFSFNTTDSKVNIDERCVSADVRQMLRQNMIDALENKKKELLKEFEDL
jgi:hypothetical protein